MQKTSKFAQSDAFHANSLKIHAIYVNWAPSSVMEPPIAIPKFVKKQLKRQMHIPCQCENPTNQYILKFILSSISSSRKKKW